MSNPILDFYNFPKAEQKLLSDLHSVSDDALGVVGHIQVIVDDAISHSAWFDDDKDERISDGGLVPHLSTTLYQKSYNECTRLEDELLVGTPDVVTVGDISASCSHIATYRLMIGLYQLIVCACNGQQPEENRYRYFQSFESFPDAFSLYRAKDILQGTTSSHRSDSPVRTVASILYNHPILPLKREEYFNFIYRKPTLKTLFPSIEMRSLEKEELKQYHAKHSEVLLKESQKIQELLEEDIVKQIPLLRCRLEEKNSEIRDWIKLHFQVSGNDLARLEAGVIREFVIARNNRLSIPDYQAPPPIKPNAISFGDGRFQIDGTEIQLDHAKAKVLEALVKRRSATKAALCDDTGVENPGRKLKEIREKYPIFSPYITLPGRKGRGGYTTRIKPAEELDAS